jgi:hypothetical protein
MSTPTKSQFKTYGPRPVTGYGSGATITATVRFDDQCGNGHNTFSITAVVVTPASKRRNDIEAGGCLHEDIARVFPELAPFIKWHLCSTDGPMHYVGNTVYHAGIRDCHGLLAGEFRQHTSRGKQNGGVEGVPNWVLVIPDLEVRDVYSTKKPTPVVCEWKPYGRTGEGKARELDAARSAAVWPEATDAELCAEPAELRAALLARLPALLADFRRDVESLGFVW